MLDLPLWAYEIINAVPAQVWLALAIAVGLVAGWCLKRTRTAIVASLAFAMLAFPVAADAAQGINRYGYPTSDVTDLHACITEQGGYPGPDGAWAGVSQATVDQCQNQTVWREGKWNWDARIPE